MRLNITEFFSVLKKGQRLRGASPTCGEVYIRTKYVRKRGRKRGRKIVKLVMHWPEDAKREILDKYGDFVPAERVELTISLKKFESFAEKIFAGVDFFMQLPDEEDDVHTD